MRQFQVPQFITVEDKVIGPFTIKQFLYLGAGGLLILGARTFLLPFIFWPLAVLIGATAASLAFLRLNEQPFPTVLKNAAFYFLRPRLYLWKQESPKKLQEKTPAPQKEPAMIKKIPTLSESRLSDLAWSLDIKEKLRQ